MSFKRRFLTFLNENRNYFPDLKFNVSFENASRAELWNGAFEITASRYAYIINLTLFTGCLGFVDIDLGSSHQLVGR